jgi:hypothetical protein
MHYVTISHKQGLTVVSSTKGAANDDGHFGDLGTAGTRQIPSFRKYCGRRKIEKEIHNLSLKKEF